MCHSRPRWAPVALLALLLLAMLPFAVLTLFAHPYFDDYNVANNVATLGRWASQWQWYRGWSGRVVTIFLDTMLDPLSWGQLGASGSGVLAALRALLLLAQLGQLVAAQQFFRVLLRVLRPAGLPLPGGLAWGLALALTVLALNVMPDPFSFLYWYSAVFVYQLAWALCLGFGAGALRALTQPAAGRGWAGLAGGCLVAAIGSSELAMLYCLVALAGLGWWARAAAPAQRRLVGQWVLLAAVATAVVLTAPGNWQRHTATDAYPQAHRWLLLLPRAGLALLSLLARPVVLGSAGLLAVVGLWVGQQLRQPPAAPPPRARLLLVGAGYLVFNLIGPVFMKLLWVDPLLGRVQNLLLLVWLAATLVLALWVGTWWQPAALRRLRLGWATGLLAAGLLGLLGAGQGSQAWQELLWTAPTYNRQMLARYALLRRAHAQGQAEAVLPPLRLPLVPGVLVPLQVPGRPADFSVELKPTAAGNTEIAQYYGLPAVRRQASAARPQQ